MIFIEIYSRDSCPACTTAKNMLNAGGTPFQEYIIDKDITRNEVIEKFPDAKSLPVIVVDGKVITEPQDFKMLLEGKL